MGEMNRIEEPAAPPQSQEPGSPSAPAAAQGATPSAATAAAGGREAGGQSVVEPLREELERARAEAADYKDKYLRALAEVENVRRRAEQELANAHKYAVERFAAEIVAVRDSLELARNVDLGPEVPEVVRKMHEGLDLTLKLLDKVFQQFGLTQIDPQGEKFDPTRQHAIGMVESEGVAPNHVVNVVQKGYMLHDRVLRPALVVVARGPEAAAAARETENPAGGA